MLGRHHRHHAFLRLAHQNLFGHERGSFTGAVAAKSGLLEAAKIVGGDIGAEALKGGGQAAEELQLPGANLLLPLGQDAPAGQQLADHHGIGPGAAIKPDRSVRGSDTPPPAEVPVQR